MVSLRGTTPLDTPGMNNVECIFDKKAWPTPFLQEGDYYLYNSLVNNRLTIEHEIMDQHTLPAWMILE